MIGWMAPPSARYFAKPSPTIATIFRNVAGKAAPPSGAVLRAHARSQRQATTTFQRVEGCGRSLPGEQVARSLRPRGTADDPAVPSGRLNHFPLDELRRQHVDRVDLRRRAEQHGRVRDQRLRDRAIEMRLAPILIGEGVEHAEGRRTELQCEPRSEEHTSELQSRRDLVCRLLLEKKKQL